MGFSALHWKSLNKYLNESMKEVGRRRRRKEPGVRGIERRKQQKVSGKPCPGGRGYKKARKGGTQRAELLVPNSSRLGDFHYCTQLPVL